MDSFITQLSNIKNFNKETESILQNFEYNKEELIKIEKSSLINENNKYILDVTKIKSDYTRILLFRNKLLECFLIIWKPYSESNIHDHSKHGCYYKVIEGNFLEFLYDKSISIIELLQVLKNDVRYINNDIGYHKIRNNNVVCTYSIHVYSPPEYRANNYI